MAITLNVGALKTRESTADPWQSSVIKSDAVTDANSITYDSTETYDAGTVGEALNEQKNTLNQLDAEKADEASLAYRRSGETNTGAQIETGTFFYLDGTLKRAIATIPQNTSFTAQNCETVTAGGLNFLEENIKNASQWHEDGAGAGSNVITVPNTWSEISILVYIEGQTTRTFSFLIPRGGVAAGTTYILRNGYYASEYNNAYVAVNFVYNNNLTVSISLFEIKLTGVDYLSASSFLVKHKNRIV